MVGRACPPSLELDRKSTRLNSSPDIVPLSSHSALPILALLLVSALIMDPVTASALLIPLSDGRSGLPAVAGARSEEHTSELQPRYRPSFLTLRSSDLSPPSGERADHGSRDGVCPADSPL